MSRNPPPATWDPASKLFHWSTVVLILALFVLGWLAVSWPMSPTKIQLFNWHKSLGLLTLGWVLLRLFWRFTHTPPALPGTLSRRERRAARLSHGALYCLMLAMPLSGWVINSAADFPLKWFGLFHVPPLVAPDAAVQDAAEAVHFALFWTLLGVILLHTAAALRHHYIHRNDVLRRMLPFGGGRG